MHNKIFPPVTENDMILDPNERSCFQLLELYKKTKNNATKKKKIVLN